MFTVLVEVLNIQSALLQFLIHGLLQVLVLKEDFLHISLEFIDPIISFLFNNLHLLFNRLAFALPLADEVFFSPEVFGGLYNNLLQLFALLGLPRGLEYNLVLLIQILADLIDSAVAVLSQVFLRLKLRPAELTCSS